MVFTLKESYDPRQAAQAQSVFLFDTRTLKSDMTLDPLATDFTVSHDLRQRWPDANLSKSFRQLLSVYGKLSTSNARVSGDPSGAVREGYEAICRWMQSSAGETATSYVGAEDGQQQSLDEVRSLFAYLKANYGRDWLQSVASLSGMLMHFSLGSRGANLLVNHRRPQKPFSTYPTSPSVARLVGDAVVCRLLKHPIPAICPSLSSAERFAERALAFRVLDPSMESGQLLLEVAGALIRRVTMKHSLSSSAASYLNRALLEKLCRDCLWGIDRNELAVIAVRILFSLLGAEFGIRQLAPTHIVTADALDYFNCVPPDFDAVINNPPWGKVLRASERNQLRQRFTTLRHQSDTYVAFSEMAIGCLRPDGVFALILPSQAVAAYNTARLRALLLSKTELDQMILLPRSAFANATVRGFVLLGRTKPTKPTAGCRVTTYPVIKRFDAVDPAASFIIRGSDLRLAGEGSWWPVLSGIDPKRPQAGHVRLEEVASVISGVHLYRKGDGVPPQTVEVVRDCPYTLFEPGRGTVPAIQGRDVREFHVRDPRRFIKLGRWLAWVGNHDALRCSTRVFVRELCRRDGKLSAAVARDGFVPLRGVLTVVPKMINVYALVGILNSTIAANYVCRHAASFSKVDFQKVTVGELRRMPIPIAALSVGHRSKLGQPASTERELLLRQRLIVVARKLSDATVIRKPKAERLIAEVNTVVSAMSDLAEHENA
jgi:Eco57I restriction-modification methylase/TaqI-like C-terminal specificity domain